MAGGSGAATKACRTATSLSDGETGWGGRKAQVNTVALRPTWASGSYRQRAGWRGPRRFRERKSSIQHIQICPRHRREGWARRKASSSSCLAGRWRESSLSFQRCGSAGPQRYTDPQVVAQVGIWAGWLEYRVLEPTEREREDRTIAGRRGRWHPHASFNSGISAGRESKHSCHPMRVSRAHLIPLQGPPHRP